MLSTASCFQVFIGRPMFKKPANASCWRTIWVLRDLINSWFKLFMFSPVSRGKHPAHLASHLVSMTDDRKYSRGNFFLQAKENFQTLPRSPEWMPKTFSQHSKQ